MTDLLAGFGTGMSLLVGIGLQNTFIIKQGLKREHIFWIAVVCSLSDLILESLGILGFGQILSQMSLLITISKIVGALFMLFYAAKHLKSAFFSKEAMTDENFQAQSLKECLLLLLAFTWLNPSVYLDTILLIGSISVKYEKILFLIGSISASVLWFFALGYAASLFSPLFKNPKAWRFLDFAIAVLMLLIAYHLVF